MSNTTESCSHDAGTEPCSGDSASGPDVSDERLLGLLREAVKAPALSPATPLTTRPPAAAPDPLVGRTLGHYRVLERLGAGGMGVVYKAEDQTLRRFVALKVLSRSLADDGEAKARLLREARSAAAVAHPNIAAVHGLEDHEGVAFLVMEHIEGATLRARCRIGPLPAREALDTAVAIARGLARAHAAHIVHRDLKPDNVMVGADGQIKILDFGLAKVFSSTLRTGNSPFAPARCLGEVGATQVSADGRIVGTPAYMSPEQREGGLVDARSDIYSFGVLLFELVTGKLPPPAGDDRPRELPLRDVETRLGPKGPSVAFLLRRCLAEHPSQRFAEGGELLEALLEIRAEPAALPEPAEPTVPPARRRRRLLAVAAATVLAAGAVAAGVASFSRSIAAVGHEPGGDAFGAGRIQLRRVTANPSKLPIQHAELSPDGATLAYLDEGGLHLRPIDSPVGRTLPWNDGPLVRVSWLPSGDALVVGAKRLDDASTQLWVVSLADGARRALARGTFAWFRVSPDGQRLAYVDRDEVGVLPLAGGERRPLVPKGPGCTVGELTWSPDGRRIAYLRRCFTSLRSGTIESIPAEGGTPAVALSDPRLFQASSEGGLVWLPDGQLVYALAQWFPSESGSNLWSVPVDGDTGRARAAPRPRTDWNGVIAGVFSYSAPARRLAFVRFHVQSDVYVAEIEGGGAGLGARRRVTPTDRDERMGTWADDGRGLYFFSDFNGNYDIFFRDLAADAPVALTSEPASETFPQLAPGGAVLYFRLPFAPDLEPVRPTLMKAGPGGGAARVLWSAKTMSYPAGAGRPQPWEARVRCPRAPSARCVVGESDEEKLLFSSLDLATGATEPLREIVRPTSASSVWVLSPGGDRLAIPTQRGTIQIAALRGGPVVELAVGESCQPAYPTWSADGQGLFTSAECSAGSTFQLLYLGLDGGRHVLWTDPVNWFLENEASPDGKHLAVSVKEFDDDVWIADGL